MLKYFSGPMMPFQNLQQIETQNCDHSNEAAYFCLATESLLAF